MVKRQGVSDMGRGDWMLTALCSIHCSWTLALHSAHMQRMVLFMEGGTAVLSPLISEGNHFETCTG